MAQPHILIVDDEAFFRKLYCGILADEGYRVDACDNGEVAIARMQSEPIDLVLTDMVMPGRDGLQVLEASRSLENPPDVILVTGHASLENVISLKEFKNAINS